MASAPGIPHTPINPSLFLQISKAGSNILNLMPGDVLSLDILEMLPDNQYLMNLKGTAITVKSETPLNPGEKLQVKVQSLQPKLILQAMNVPGQTSDAEALESDVQKRVRPGALLQVVTGTSESSGNIKPTARPISSLVHGQNLTVTVQEKLPGNKYILDLSGTTVTVKSEAPIIAGDKLNVRVQSVQPQLILKVLEPQEQTTGLKSFENQGPKGVQPAFQKSGVAGTLSPFDQIKTAGRTAPELSPGQTLTVTVQERLPENRYQVAIRDVSITATSEVPLKEGDRLQVKVQSIQPQIVLSVIDAQKQATEAKINEKLISWRINPEALTQILSKVDEFSADLKSISPLDGFSTKDADNLLKLLNNIILSPKTRLNPLFVKDFISQIGFMLEKDLAAIASQKSIDGNTVPVENLKAMLLKLSESISRTLQDTAKLDSSTIGKFQNVASFSAEVLKNVENGQAVNVVYQQNEDGLYLQIPLVLGEAYRQADIFIRPDDKNAPASRKYSSCSVNIFLNLDYLGEIAIDVGLREGRIRCIIKCENEETRELLNISAKSLEDALTEIGYGVGRIECIKTSDLAELKAEFIGQQIFRATEMVNSYA